MFELKIDGYICESDNVVTDKGLVDRSCFNVFDTQGHEIGVFDLVPMPGNCGIVVSTGTIIYEGFQGHGYSYILHQFKEAIAKMAGYTVMICTVTALNERQLRSARKVGWEFNTSFVNQRTGNTCLIGIKNV